MINSIGLPRAAALDSGRRPALRASNDAEQSPPTGRLAAASAAARGSAWLSRQPVAFGERLLRSARFLSFARDDKIIGLETEGSDLCFLFEGAVQVAVPRADLEVVPTHVLSPSEWFGEYGAVTGRASIAEYRASMPCSVLAVPRSALLTLAAAEPAFQPALTELLAGACRAYLELAAGLTGLKSEERVRSKLHALSGQSRGDAVTPAIVRISQEELAAVSCVSRSVVWKVLGQLAGEGTIRCGYRSIAVIDRERLISGAA